jgi:DNA (cytosine-5)-methyltransferase 1
LRPFRFIDLFAGIGGFHQALSSLGGECVFASEIDAACLDVYKRNYGIDAGHDITKVDERDIPEHDVLCAGFPCQSFSKAGGRRGFHDTRGTLFFDIERILRKHKTKYIILENVRNLVTHDGGNTWQVIQDNLRALGYRLTERPLIVSPHEFGVPQLRERVFILGVHDPKHRDRALEIRAGGTCGRNDTSVYDFVEDNAPGEFNISAYEARILSAWDEFYRGIEQRVIGFPVWAEEFGSTYATGDLPGWKQQFIERNRQLYETNEDFIAGWLADHGQLREFAPTHRKFEWQAGESIGGVWEGLIQLRPSGVRVKRPTVVPALVAIVQIPILGKYRRRLTPVEAARLQSFDPDFGLDANHQRAYRQLGNSVNVEVIRHLAAELLDRACMLNSA